LWQSTTRGDDDALPLAILFTARSFSLVEWHNVECWQTSSGGV